VASSDLISSTDHIALAVRSYWIKVKNRKHPAMQREF
jgi:hypothetical protein